MIWTVILAQAARRDMRRLNPQVAGRIVRALQRFAETEQGDVIRLRGVEREWRLRVGDSRTRCALDHAEGAAWVTSGRVQQWRWQHKTSVPYLRGYGGPLSHRMD